jgi:hypothetical protein
MTLHRPGHLYSRRYAERKLAQASAMVDYWHAQRVGSDWRQAADKAAGLRKWEAEEFRWQCVLNPQPIEVFELPF